MNAIRATCVTLLVLGLAACGAENEQSAQVPAPAETPEVASAATPDILVRNVVADAVPFQPAAAKVDGDALQSTGVAGFVMFGPYVAMSPGNYRVNVIGSIAELPENAAVHFDAVSGKGSNIHGEQAVSTTSASAGTIAEFDVKIPSEIQDLEVRASVPDGVNMRIQSYSVTPAN